MNWDWLSYVTCLDTFFDLKPPISEVAQDLKKWNLADQMAQLKSQLNSLTETTTIIVKFWELCCLIHNMKHQWHFFKSKYIAAFIIFFLHKHKWKQDVLLEFSYIMLMFMGIFFGSWQSDKKQLIYRISYCFQFSLCQNNLPSFSLSYLTGQKMDNFLPHT